MAYATGKINFYCYIICYCQSFHTGWSATITLIIQSEHSMWICDKNTLNKNMKSILWSQESDKI